MKVVVDTSIVIDHLRGGTKWEDFQDSAEKDMELFLPTIAIFELFSGESTKNPHKLRDMIDFVGQFQKIALSEEIAQKASELFRDIKIKLQVPDYIIAASAINLDGSVLTLNKKHFQQIPNLKVY